MGFSLRSGGILPGMPEYEVWEPPSERVPDTEATSNPSPYAPPGSYQPVSTSRPTSQPWGQRSVPTHTAPPTRWRRPRKRRWPYVLVAWLVLGGGMQLVTHHALSGMPSAPDFSPPGAGAATAPFVAQTFWPDADVRTGRFSATIKDRGSSHTVRYQRLSSKVAPGGAGCDRLPDGHDGSILENLGCTGRITTTWRTSEGVGLRAVVLKFPDASAAKQAATTLQPAGLAPDPWPPSSDAQHPSAVDAQSVYVVATVAEKVPHGVDAATLARSVHYLQAEAVTTIIWL